MNYETKRFFVQANGTELRFLESGKSLQKPALLLQPSLGLLLFVGESDEAGKRKRMLEAVQDLAESLNVDFVVVPLGLNNPYGFSAQQAAYVINRMICDIQHFVVQFYEHLCLDDDLRGWIESEMQKQTAA